MPHIVLKGPVDLHSFYTGHKPVAREVAGEILKLHNIFMNQRGDILLIEALAVEHGPPNRFFVQIGRKDAKTTVKIYPGSDPEKTPGVKKLLALVAQQVKARNPQADYGHTNLQEFLLP